MIAAFCEVLRTIEKRLGVTAPLEGTAILREAQRFHYTLVLDLIDDSDGYHVLNEAHLETLYTELRRLCPASPTPEACEEHLRTFEAHRTATITGVLSACSDQEGASQTGLVAQRI